MESRCTLASRIQETGRGGGGRGKGIYSGAKWNGLSFP